MSNLPQIYENENFGQIRVIMKDDEPWFVAKDVCECLGIDQSSGIRNLDDDEKGLHTVQTPGGPQNLSAISESGLYSCILRSRKPEARAFKRWVTHDVIPSIRKTGSYSINQDSYLKPMLEDLNRKIDQMAIAFEEMKPKAIFYDAVTENENLYDMKKTVKVLKEKGYNIGRNQLFKLLRDRHILMIDNEPYQRYVNMDLFKMVIDKHSLNVKTVATTKGLQYIKRLLDSLK